MRRHDRTGLTLIEIIWVIVLVGLMASLGIPRIRDALQKQSARSARVAGATLVVTARAAAVQRGCRATLNVLNDGRLFVEVCRISGAVGFDTLGRVDVTDRYGVTVTPSRNQIAFGPRGLTLGDQSATVVFQRTPHADTLIINAVGKVVR